MTRYVHYKQRYKLYREFIYAPQSRYMRLLDRYMTATYDTANDADCTELSTTHTVTVSSLTQSNKQANKQIESSTHRGISQVSQSVQEMTGVVDCSD